MLLAVKTDPKAWKAALEGWRFCQKIGEKIGRKERFEEKSFEGKILTSVSSVDPALELLDLRLLPEHLPGVGLHPALVLRHVPEERPVLEVGFNMNSDFSGEIIQDLQRNLGI